VLILLLSVSYGCGKKSGLEVKVFGGKDQPIPGAYEEIVVRKLFSKVSSQGKDKIEFVGIVPEFKDCSSNVYNNYSAAIINLKGISILDKKAFDEIIKDQDITNLYKANYTDEVPLGIKKMPPTHAILLGECLLDEGKIHIRLIGTNGVRLGEVNELISVSTEVAIKLQPVEAEKKAQAEPVATKRAEVKEKEKPAPEVSKDNDLEAEKVAWVESMKKMKEAFVQVQKYEKKPKVTAELKAAEWEKFVSCYSKRNPYSDEDEKMRSEAKKRIAELQAEKAVANKKASRTSSSSRGDSGIITYNGLQWYEGPDRETTWDQANDWVSSLSVGGSGWRMPTRAELKCLYHKRYNWMVDERAMPPEFKTNAYGVWTREQHDSSNKCFVYIGGNHLCNMNGDNSHQAFAVRSRGSSGIIIYNGLQWYEGPDRDTSWDQASAWVSSLGGGWRMPTRAELKGLYHEGMCERNIPWEFKTTGWFIWSREQFGLSDAWGLNFFDGHEEYHIRSLSGDKRAFAVRSRR
jgi:hypothetical protein